MVSKPGNARRLCNEILRQCPAALPLHEGAARRRSAGVWRGELPQGGGGAPRAVHRHPPLPYEPVAAALSAAPLLPGVCKRLASAAPRSRECRFQKMSLRISTNTPN
jgi:hypothetical protein